MDISGERLNNLCLEWSDYMLGECTGNSVPDGGQHMFRKRCEDPFAKRSADRIIDWCQNVFI